MIVHQETPLWLLVIDGAVVSQPPPWLPVIDDQREREREREREIAQS